MFSTLHIEGYRCFENFDIRDLGRVNLLVGTNNSGKTTVLEALDILTSRGDPVSLGSSLRRRGERLLTDRIRSRELEMDVSHLFTGHDLHIGSKFLLSATNQISGHYVSFEIVDLKAQQELDFAKDADSISELAIRVKGNPTPVAESIPITRAGSIRGYDLDVPERSRIRRDDIPSNPTLFVTAQSMTTATLVSMWDNITLTPDEAFVLSALQTLDPDLERIASQSGDSYHYGSSKGGFVVVRKGEEQRVPIGSMGDGMWRMLAVSVAITQCKGGVLLVDEIDTGLHHTVMYDMWRLIYKIAIDLDVQVFATTHSLDCVFSLARVCSHDLRPNHNITLQRIEPGKHEPVRYTEGQIIAASEMEFEVR